MELPDWTDRTVACIATGPSLSRAQIELIADASRIDHKLRVLAVCDAGLPAREPFTVHACDVWYAPDHRFWMHYRESLAQRAGAIRVGAQNASMRAGLVHSVIEQAIGGHAGIQAIKLALDLGATTVLLLGYDCRAQGDTTNYFGRKPPPLQYQNPEPYSAWVPRYRKLEVPPGSRVINCSPGSAIDAFPRAALAELLEQRSAVA